MNRRPDHNRQDPGPDSAGRLAEFNARFLRAVERASMIQQSQHKRRRQFNQLAAALVFLACVALGVAALLRQPDVSLLVAPAEAEGFGGVEAVVISNYNRHVVPGVEVFELGAADGGATRQVLAATTDSQGIFSIPIDDRAAQRKYELRYQGAKVGEFIAGSGEQAASGYQRIRVDVPPEQLQRGYQVSIEPGVEAPLSELLAVRLDQQAGGAWDGTVTHDERWPTEFNYGDVLCGVFSVAGAVPAGLRLRAKVSAQQLELSQAAPADLRLIAHSAEYYAEARSNPDPIERAMADAMAMCHRGWYIATDPPLDSLPAVKLAVDASPDGGAWLEWLPEPGRRYAVIAPPDSAWQAAVVYDAPGPGRENQPPYANVSLIQQSARNSVAWIYDVEQFPVEREGPFYLPVYPQAYYPSVSVRTPEPRGYGDQYEWHTAMLEQAEGGIIPADYYLRRYDLTATTPQRQGPFRVNTAFRPGSYQIISSEPLLGSEIALELTGDLDRISGEPLWDFDLDAVPDAFGLRAHYLATAPGSKQIVVTLKDRSGEFVRVHHRLNVLSDGLLSCSTSGHATNAIVAGVSEPPERESSFWIITEKVIAGRSSNSLNITNTGGPTMYIEPPAGWVGKRLKEARLVLYISPRAGDYERMFISFSVDTVQATTDPAAGFANVEQLEGEIGGEPLPLWNGVYQSVGVCWPTELALRAEDDGDESTTARQTWLDYLKSETVIFWVRTNLGFDLFDPPPNEELVRILREFKQSPYYAVKYATEEHQELRYATPLFNTRVTPDLAFLIGTSLEHLNRLLASQYEVYSGGRFPARVELETTDGEVFTRYFDYSVLEY